MKEFLEQIIKCVHFTPTTKHPKLPSSFILLLFPMTITAHVGFISLNNDIMGGEWVATLYKS